MAKGFIQDLKDEKYQLMVLPVLRRYADPQFDTVGEAVDCYRQIIQVQPISLSSSS